MADNKTETAETDKEPKTTSEQVKLWQERVSIAKDASERWAKDSGADRFVEEYNGNFTLFMQGLKGKIPVPPINEVFAYVNADVAITYNRDPYISVNPTAGTVKGAKIWEVVLNYDWRRLRTKEEVELEIVDKDLAGLGFHKVGHEVESEGAEQDLEIVDETLFSGRIDWKDLVWNLGSMKPPYDCLWMAQRIVKPLKYVKKKYNAPKLKGVQDPRLSKKAYENASFKDDISVVVLWEVWDKMGRQIYLVAEGMEDKFLAPPRPWPDYMDEFPFLIYWDIYAPGKMRPMSAIASWEPQILEKMVIMAAAVNHAKRWSRQALIKKGAISGPDLDKFETGYDGAIIDYVGTGDLDKNFKMVDWGNIPVDYYQLMDRLAAIERDVNGQPEFERGGVTKTSTRTDGELDKIAAGAKGRSDRRIDRFETHLENIARHMMMHRKANFDFEQTVKVTGNTPQEVIEALGDHFDPITRTVKFFPQDIQGDYDVEIKAGSTLPLDRGTKSEIVQNLIQTLANLDTNAVSPLLEALIEELLEDFGGIKKLKEAYAEQKAIAAKAAATTQQDTDANEAKARSQAAKNVASADKIAAEADKLRVEPPFGPMHQDLKPAANGNGR